jgi:hypothetical protein
MAKYHWLSRRVLRGPCFKCKIHYFTSQLSLDLCGWKPSRRLLKKVPLIRWCYPWYVGKKHDSIRH